MDIAHGYGNDGRTAPVNLQCPALQGYPWVAAWVFINADRGISIPGCESDRVFEWPADILQLLVGSMWVEFTDVGTARPMVEPITLRVLC